ncbi:hypothetical protein ABZW03_15985 [Kitasatospora sp. NPDC004799]|uniref:hypothetical protein n=1 Tax=Kitasatospora sp. NPDC004799 TaxID=3154460 RepID=UPI0033B6CC9D
MAVFLSACAVVIVGCVWWGAAALLRSGHPPERDVDRAERMAGLHHEQHPGKGRYYIPTDTVMSHAPDGSKVAYLHYALDGGDDVNVDDFLRTYGLARPGASAPLPEDLRAALPGEEPAEGARVPEKQVGRQVFVVESPSAVLEGAADIYVRATGT